MITSMMFISRKYDMRHKLPQQDQLTLRLVFLLLS
jgi:hypothetical protein